jgi:hypothetical protein
MIPLLGFITSLTYCPSLRGRSTLTVPLDSGVFLKGSFFINNDLLFFKIKEPEIYIIINNDKIYAEVFSVVFDEYTEADYFIIHLQEYLKTIVI